jgi:D-alanine-D-alanine ligase
MFVKPANLGSSVGVSKAKDRAELAAGIEHAFEFDEKVIAEEGVAGAREIECAVLGDDEPIASVPGEIVVEHPDGFYSYDAKYVDEHGATIKIPADLNPAEVNATRSSGRRAASARWSSSPASSTSRSRAASGRRS